ncbi:C39 family peptidase [Collinsella aerofaciens]|uniref:C39 family peptidase n=1 Tax=Collinsella aerofaciens TaxID=74426 RepID=UPI0034A27647
MKRSMKRVSGAAAVLAVAAALALCGPAAYAAPAAAGDTQPLPGEAQPAGGESGAQAETAQADGGQAEAAQSDGATAVSLSYSAHVSNIGWMGAVAGGEVAGTTGRGLPLEALRLVLSDASTGEPLGADAVSVEAHVSNVGWQAAVGNGGTAGTTGQSRAVEALRVRLSGELSARYAVWYRVHSAEFGWLGWACDGADAGSAGYGRAVQAVQVAVLPKGDPAPGDTSTPFVDRSSEPPSVSYRAHVAGIGWQGAVSDGAVAGTTGQGRALEALSGSVSWYGHGSSSLEVRAHVSNVGWQGWTSGTAGTTGRSLAVEALQFRLSGEAASSYDVWYRVHCSDYGWLGWAKDGASAGTVGLSKAVQAVQVVLVPKGGAAPGPAGGAFRGAGERLSGSSLSVSGSPAGSSFSGGVLTLGSERGPVLGSVAATVDNLESDGSVCYRGLLLGSGWQGEASSDGAQLGASGGGLQLKAVRFELSGGLAERYDVWYRSCDSARGWLGWASAGEPSGVESGASGLTAVQVALVAKGSGAPGPAEGAYVSGAASGPSLVLQGHVAERGWLPAVGGGEDVGTTGRGLALQAVRASLEGAGEGSSVSVAAHVAGIGWQDAASAPSYAGTVGQGRAVQAVRVSLSGPVSERYDVWYRVHAAGYGWLGWAKDGEAAGTEGLGVQAEALQVVLVEKGGDAPSTGAPAELSVPSLSLRAHVSGVGWQPAVGNGGTAGTTGQARAVEAIAAEVSSPVSGGLSYSAHVSGVGWQDEVSGGAVAGTTGQGRAVECVKMRLTGDLSEYYDVWYRAYVQDYGWLGWASDGARAGTTGIGYRVEALQVRVLAKGSAAPGPTDGAYRDRPLHPNSVVLNVPCTMQNPELPTGCESVALTNALNYYGFGLGKTVIADAYMPKSSWDFVTAFLGNPHSASNGNCISAPGLTNTANSFLISSGSSLRAYDVTGTGFYDLYSYLEAGHPVIIWSTIGMQNLGSCYATQAYGGRVYRTYTNSHTVVLRGFNRSLGTVYIADSLAGYVSNSAQRIASLYTQRGAQAVVIK